jgi:hypothetical protein
VTAAGAGAGRVRAARARRGAPLRTVVAPDAAAVGDVTLTPVQRHDLIDLWTTLLTDVYVHDAQKRALYGIDPVRALAALRRDIPFLDSAGFLRALNRLVNRLRDQHTQLLIGTGAATTVAALPFLVEHLGAYTAPTFVVTKTSVGVPRGFRPGVRLTTWNGVPVARAVDLHADTLSGGRPDARRARALATLTQRPLAYLPPPDELWVEVGYRRPGDPASAPDRAARMEWRVLAPGTAGTADDRVVTRTHRAVDAIGEHARRARKLLFATALWEQEQPGVALAKRPGWLATTFSDVLSARVVRTSHGEFGYLRIWSFDVQRPGAFVAEVARLLAALPGAGLVIDLRANPGGVIDAAERTLALLTDRVEPARFACRATAPTWPTGPTPPAPPSTSASRSPSTCRSPTPRPAPRPPAPTPAPSSPWWTPARTPAATCSPPGSPTTASAGSSRSGPPPGPVARTCGPPRTSSTRTTPPTAPCRRCRRGSATRSPCAAWSAPAAPPGSPSRTSAWWGTRSTRPPSGTWWTTTPTCWSGARGCWWRGDPFPGGWSRSSVDGPDR